MNINIPKFSKPTQYFLWFTLAIVFYVISYFIGEYVLSSEYQRVTILNLITINNNFVSWNQSFFSLLIGFFITGLILLAVIPANLKNQCYKMILIVAVLTTIYEKLGYFQFSGLFLSIEGASLLANILENLKWWIKIILELLQSSVIKILILSVFELIFNKQIKQFITKKKVLTYFFATLLISISLLLALEFTNKYKWLNPYSI